MCKKGLVTGLRTGLQGELSVQRSPRPPSWIQGGCFPAGNGREEIRGGGEVRGSRDDPPITNFWIRHCRLV